MTDALHRLPRPSYAGRISFVLALGWFTIRLGRESLPPLLSVVIEQVAISPSEAGLAMALMWGFYSLCQFPGGRLSDDLSRTVILVVGLGIATVGFGTLTFVTTLPRFLFAVSLVGIGGGLYFVPMRALLSDLYVDDRGRVFGINLAAGAIGSAAAAGLAYVVTEWAVWQVAFLVPGLLLLLVTALLHRWSRECYIIASVDFEIQTTARRLFTVATIRRTVVVYALFTFVLQAVISFLPLFLQAEKSFSLATANASFALLYVVGMVVMPTAGKLGDRFGYRPLASLSLVTSLLGLIAMIIFPWSLLVVLGIVVFAAGIRGFSPLMQAYLMSIFPESSMGGDFGATKTIYNGFGSLGPLYVGVVADVTNYTVSFGGLVVFLLMSLSILLVGTEPANG